MANQLQMNKVLFLTAMGRYYAAQMKNSDRFVSSFGEHFKLVPATEDDGPCDLFCSAELAACTCHAIHERERDYLDYRWRDSWCKLWMEFARRWNAGEFIPLATPVRHETIRDLAPVRYETIRALKVPNTSGVADIRQMDWIFASTAYDEAKEKFPVIEQLFADWIRPKIEESGYDVRMRFIGTEAENHYFVARIDIRTVSEKDCDDAFGLPKPNAEYTHKEPSPTAVGISLSKLAAIAPEEIEALAFHECRSIDDSMRDSRGFSCGERRFFLEWGEVNAINKKLGYTGEPCMPEYHDGSKPIVMSM